MLLLKSVKSVSNSDDWINIWIGDWCLNAFNCTSARLVVFLICCAQVQLDEIQTDSLSPPLKAHALHLSVKVWFVHTLHDVNPHFESETKQYHCSFFPSENIFINSIKSNERIFFIHAFREVQQHKMNDFIRIKTLRVVFYCYSLVRMLWRALYFHAVSVMTIVFPFFYFFPLASMIISEIKCTLQIYIHCCFDVNSILIWFQKPKPCIVVVLIKQSFVFWHIVYLGGCRISEPF